MLYQQMKFRLKQSKENKYEHSNCNRWSRILVGRRNGYRDIRHRESELCGGDFN